MQLPESKNTKTNAIFATKSRESIFFMNLKINLLIIALFACITVFSQNGINDENESDGKKKESVEAGSSNKIDTLRQRFYVLDDILGQKELVSPDTFPYNYQNNTFPERNSIISAQHLGNLGSPIQSQIYTDREEKRPFIFIKNYEHWMTSPDEFRFLNTTKPYTVVDYLSTMGNDVSQEEDFKFFFSVNANKYLNVGVAHEIIYSRGFYNNNASRNKLSDIFGNYQSPRYEAFWKLSYYYNENYENGGITDDRYITQPLLMSGGLKEYESLNVPVNITDAKNRLKSYEVFFNHKYNMGFEQINPKDTNLIDFIPVTSIIHTLNINYAEKRYSSTSADTSFYHNAYISQDDTKDQPSLFNIKNTVGISLNEGFHKWAKLGVTAFAQHEFSRYSSYDSTASLKDTSDIFSRLRDHDENNLWIGGLIDKKHGELFTYSVLGKFCLLGTDIANFEIEGNAKTSFNLWRRPFSLSLYGKLTREDADHFMEKYYSNHFIWDNDFNKEITTEIGGNLDIEALGFNFNLDIQNITNHVYFNTNMVPDQYNKNIQLITAKYNQKLGLGIFHWDNNFVYQLSSNKNIIPVPDITIYSNFYLKFYYSGHLLTQIGVDCRYFTSYYAQGYCPATGQFHNQKEVKIGNYPYMNAYVNCRLKTMRFFVMYSHLSRLYADPQYFSAPHYALNPAIVKMGISWKFFN